MTSRTSRAAAVLVAAVLLLATAACTGSDSEPPDKKASSDPCSASADEPKVGTTVMSVDDRGTQKSYAVNVPSAYRAGTPMPVVILFHGGGQIGRDFMQNSGFVQESDRRGFLLVAPQATAEGRAFDFLSPVDDDASDLPMVDSVLDQVEADFCVDKQREYAAGFSIGSGMVFALACQSTTRFAAFGGVAGVVLQPSCETAPPASVIYFHGTKDETIPFGGLSEAEIDGKVPGLRELPDVRTAISEVAAHDNCARPKQTTPAPSIELYRWSSCDAGTEVEAYVIDGGGHQWPGIEPAAASPENGKATQAISASSLMWQFFSGRTLASSDATTG